MHTLFNSFREPVLGKKMVLIFLLFNCTMIYSQSDWVNYLIGKEKGLMSVHVDLGLNFIKPNYSNLLIVGSKCDGCMSNGFPTQSGLDQLYTFSDSLSLAIKRVTNNRLVGILTYQCYGFDVFYVKDTTNLRKEIKKMISDNFSRTKTHILIEYDRAWAYYYYDIFPLNAPNDFFTNHEYLGEMVSQGDDLKELRMVTHWLKFKKEKKRLKFIDEVEVLQFNVEVLSTGKDNSYPYELEIWRIDRVDPKSINKLTNLLKALAIKQVGIYDGWGAEVIINE